MCCESRLLSSLTAARQSICAKLIYIKAHAVNPAEHCASAASYWLLGMAYTGTELLESSV